MAGATTPIVVDTDLSWDDVAALGYLLRLRTVRVVAITLAGTGVAHCTPGLAHLRALVAALGQRAIPLACGRTTPLAGTLAFPAAWRRAADDFYGLALPGVPGPAAAGDAAGLLARALAGTPAPRVIELAPMTNLAGALAQLPVPSRHALRIDAMGGALAVPGNAPNGTAEYNLYVDARAAADVLASGAQVTLYPLDAASDVPMTTFVRQALAAHAAHSATARLLDHLLADPYYVSGAQYLWDPLAAVGATMGGVVHTTAVHLGVVQAAGARHGALARRAGAPLVTVATRADAAAFARQYLRVVTGDPAARAALPARSVRARFTGASWRVSGPLDAPPGALALRVENPTRTPAGVLVARIGAGHDLAAVVALARRGATTLPPWLTQVLLVTVPGGHAATWGVNLVAGTYVAVGGAPGVPLQVLTAIDVH